MSLNGTDYSVTLQSLRERAEALAVAQIAPRAADVDASAEGVFLLDPDTAREKVGWPNT